jgi:hypothetical protein
VSAGESRGELISDAGLLLGDVSWSALSGRWRGREAKRWPATWRSVERMGWRSGCWKRERSWGEGTGMVRGGVTVRMRVHLKSLV